ncbi:uncharacterized protein MELLADRAFT_90504 [Melampsora larici-populina 98AG31]|uniref:Uncharacterized protein n=1 Tax=Melampsora larici-populina (strain 98AG31 / pathotype 3-4-7) TaxID=747676 RepID=F4RX52_MELLP|nr:uncharacterized protein MELLADRAFT_90504 [Melampsora larici-populina 98AG31]EGG02905.1 hypothetical protein MELLADRAFT_90504 [Melampsora larici-populina 98AG31]
MFGLRYQCCLAYGSALCRQHPCTATTGTTHNARNDLSPTSIIRGEPTTSTSSSARIIAAQSRAPASQSNPHQWVQGYNSMGQHIDAETFVMCHQNRAARDREEELSANSLIDEKSMATIHLWVNPNEKQAITAKFPQWPLACLDQSPLLLQAVIKAVGSQWNQVLTFWDEQIYAWHDTLASYPHWFTSHTIVARLPTVTVPESAIPPSMWNPKTVTQPPSASHLETATLAQLATALKQHPDIQEPTPSTSSTHIDLTQPLNDDIESKLEQTNFDEPSSSVTVQSLKKHWPPLDSPVSSLLEWHQDTENGNVKLKWKRRWGSVWLFNKSTVYQYQNWIELVTYPRFLAKYGSQPQATVAEARDCYQDEFDKAAYVKGKVEE